MENSKKNINRRDFLKIAGAGLASVAAASTVGCGSEQSSGTEQRGGTATTEVPKGQITRANVEGTNPEISLLGYGCMRWPLIEGAKRGENPIDQEAVNELVSYAIEHGVNYFDTSPVYIQGWSEKSTGEALSRFPRESYFIATKMSNFSHYSYEDSVKMYQKSMKELQTDYFDYYLVHNVGRDMETFNARFIDNGVLDFLMEERKAGRIRKLGWSFHGVQECFDEILALHDKVHWDFVQIQLNYVDWRHATGANINAEHLYTECRKRNIPMIIMEPLLGGRLAKLPEHIINRLKERDPNVSPASWAFRYAGYKPGVFTVLSGMTYLEHLQDNIRTYSPLKPITPEEEIFLEDTAQLIMNYPTVPCNDCKYCMPCEYDLDIPAILLHYNKCVNEGNIAQNRLDPNYAEARRTYLVGYERAVPRERRADKCTGCGKCNPHCPQGIDIPKEIARIDAYIDQLKQKKA